MRLHFMTVCVLSAGLSACGPKPDAVEIKPRNDPSIAAPPSKPIVLPPSIAASKQYRCADNTLALVDFYSDDRSASVRTIASGPSVRLSSTVVGGLMSGGGYSLKGAKSDDKVMFSSPAHQKPQVCHI